MSRAATSPPPHSPQTVAMLTRLADALPWPLLVLQPDGLLVHANRAGRQLLAGARPLRCDTLGRVTPGRAAQRVAFQGALTRALAGETVVLRWPGRPHAKRGSLHRLPGEAAPPLLLLAVEAVEGSGLGLPNVMDVTDVTDATGAM